MKRYLFLSGSGHFLLLAAWISSGALLSKPRMSYYSIDLMSSLPAGGSSVKGGGTDLKAAKEAPPPAVVEERRLPVSEVIKVRGKEKAKKPPVPSKTTRKPGLNLKAALAVLEGEGKGAAGRAGIPGGSGLGITADAGSAFPYPWYLKTIAERLNRQWHPPQDFQEDTMCQIVFVIHKDGQVTDMSIEKASGDPTFDQLAQRAILYSNPLPPLPAGFPDEILRVHMKFMGKE